MKLRYLFFLMTLAIGFTACSEDDNPQNNQASQEAVVNLHFDSTMEAQTNQMTNESHFIFSSGIISVEDLIFRVANGDDTYEIDVLQGSDSLLTINLITGMSNFVLDYFLIPTGKFHQVEVTLITGAEQSVLAGTFVDAKGEEFPIEVILPRGEPIVVRSEGDFVFLDSDAVDAELMLNPNSWVSHMNASILNQLQTTEDGRIVISETMNSDTLHIILKYLEQSSNVLLTQKAPSFTQE